MKHLIFVALFLIFSYTLAAQNTVKSDEFTFDLNRTNIVNNLPVDVSPESVLSGDLGNLKKVPVIDADTLYPRIVTAASDTTGRIAEKAGDMFINTATGKVYVSTGAGRGKYVILNFFLMVLLILGKGKCEEK